MASLNDRAAGQDFEGNGPSSFDPRDTYVFDASGEDLSDSRWAEKVAAVKAAEAQCERAFGKWDRALGRYVPHAPVRRAAA